MTDQVPLESKEPTIALAGTGEALPDNVVLLLPGAGPGPMVEQPLVVHLKEALDASSDMILVVEQSGRVLFANTAARQQLGLPDHDATFHAIETLLTGYQREEIWKSFDSTSEWRGGLSISRADGSALHLKLTLMADRTTTGDIPSLTVVARDVGEQRSLQDTLEHRSTHDGLTGLANRQHLLRQLNELLPQLADRGEPGALLLLDIDEFRTVTNSLGHEAGDRVLVAFAYRLLRIFPTDALLARVGGDEFAIFCPGEDDVETLADQTLRATKAPFYIDGAEVHLSAVTGIAITTAEAPTERAEALLREADAASHRAKERGRGTVEIFAPQLQTDAVDRLSVVQDLRRALDNEELRAVYQPKISLRTGAIVGAEALMRWLTPDGVTRSPETFMDVAEDTGLIIPMGRWMLDEVCQTGVRLQDAMPVGQTLELSVNLSVRQLDQPSFADDVELALTNSGMPAQLLELEITESALMNDVEASADLLTQLKQLGTRIAVDDFGTGYSSLQYLQRLPVDVLKVDQVFVAGIEDQPGDQAIVRAVIQLAEALHLTSVAEGVETSGQLQRLREMGCAQAQGYHIARPMSATSLAELVATAPTW